MGEAARRKKLGLTAPRRKKFTRGLPFRRSIRSGMDDFLKTLLGNPPKVEDKKEGGD